jgi:hypothetical protein
LHITDVNDNAPVFHQASYVVHVAENNPPGASIEQVRASDPDLGPNGQVSYSIVASDLEPRALSSYVSVNPQSGVVFAQRAFDHEQLRAFELTLQARDHGSPALSSNVSLRVLVGDRNDNAPRVLYPALGPDGSALFDTVPRAAQPGDDGHQTIEQRERAKVKIGKIEFVRRHKKTADERRKRRDYQHRLAPDKRTDG